MASRKLNPPCRHCGGTTHLHKELKKGGTTHRCNQCRRYTSVGASSVGAPKTDNPKSSAERNRKYLESLSPEERAAIVENNRLRRLAKRRAKQAQGESK